MNRITTVGIGRHGDCHCICHYQSNAKHVIACCDQCYQQYDASIMLKDRMEDTITEITDYLLWCTDTERVPDQNNVEVLKYLLDNRQ